MKTLSLALLTSFLLAVAAPAFAQDAPKTKADCDKAAGTWDEKTMTCTVKK
jgi:ABC-type proline/glycine betaine transport system substrate-binding protein